VKARAIKGLDPSAPLDANAARMVKTRLKELRSFVPAALAPSAEREQHDMRIAAKRLRYILEISGFCFGAPGRRAEAAARELQDVLGEIHDCDVMAPRVAGIETLATYMEARRSVLFERFTELWLRQERSGVWSSLDAAAKRV
jgi:CHAD domain-containing protein